MSLVTQLFSLNGRIALVTGSTGGIGGALAKGLAQAGAKVVINGRDEARAAKAAESLRAEGLDATHAAFDVTAPEAVAAGVARIEDEVGPIGILINNAGVQQRAPAEEFPLDGWKRVLGANLEGPFFVAQAVGQHMLGRGEGRIINICSVMSELGRASIVPYTASKGGIKMLTKGLATEWGPKGINVNGIGPGYFATEMNTALVEDAKFTGWLEQRTPQRRWGKVEELVGAAIYLASPASSFVNGHILYVDGGMTASV
ncbi:MAG: SDR family oxidoreductase [Proteobacteria bacterium]|nr:SDR family oxidoreductase [Pseudomonadota bacterium]